MFLASRPGNDGMTDAAQQRRKAKSKSYKPQSNRFLVQMTENIHGVKLAAIVNTYGTVSYK